MRPGKKAARRRCTRGRAIQLAGSAPGGSVRAGMEMDGKDLLTGSRYVRCMRLTITAAFLLFAVPALAQDISGPARAVDGDSLDLSGISVRLFGVDAPELAQSCERGGAPWACGKQAASKLAGLVAGTSVVCEQKDVDDYGRIVATCRAGSVDLGSAMVDAGLAVALPHFSDRYVAAEARARATGVGVWTGTFQMPADFRAAHPRPGRRTPGPSRDAAPVRAPSPGPSDAYFRNCKDAWAAGRPRCAEASPVTVLKWTVMATASLASPIAAVSASSAVASHVEKKTRPVCMFLRTEAGRVRLELHRAGTGLNPYPATRAIRKGSVERSGNG